MTSSKTVRPLAVTMGDPAGIGPEIVLKLLACSSSCQPYIGIGDVGIFKKTASQLALPDQIVQIESLEEFDNTHSCIQVIQSGQSVTGIETGQVSAQAGKTAFDAINLAVDFALTDQVAGVVTAPIHKEAFAAAGVKFPGHTELLADRAKLAGHSCDVSMMLANKDIRTILVSIHISLAQAVRAVTFEAELKAIETAHQAGLELGIENPRIAVAGLNPHAGEGGLFGREEIDFISPAIEAARAKGINASGPWSGDTVFMQARMGVFDIVVAQYHDQGLIPVKYLGLEEGVNVTLGLPFIRTSPDHGTAFDIAGTGKANPASMLEAAKYAWKMVEARASN